MAKSTLTSSQVMLFYPNLIGYLRFILMAVSFYTAFDNWQVSIICYLGAFVGDVVDGYVARAFKQCK
ncbi:CDP-alcohol phosphatidyltransferase family protein [archaeon]|nr:MAG: CDP-alcohol phosphatidyltransferase family protein [archaeon]